MELQQLRYILAIRHYGNLSRAAEQLFVSQPTLSLQLKKLEEDLGLILIDRTTRSLKMTEAGEEFCAYATQVVDAYDALEARMLALKATQCDDRHISIAYSNRQRYIALHDAISVFFHLNPSISVSILNIPERDMPYMLDKGELDVAFMRESIYRYIQTPLNYGHDIVVTEPIVIVLRPDHPLAGEKCLTASHFSQLHFISASSRNDAFQGNQRLIKGFQYTRSLERAEIDDHDTMAAFVKKSNYAAFASLSIARYYGLAGIPFVPPTHDNTLMLYLQKKAERPIIKEFRDFILDYYSDWENEGKNKKGSNDL